MPRYDGIKKEETLKGLVFKDYFDGRRFGYEPNIDNIDFVVTDPRTRGDGARDLFARDLFMRDEQNPGAAKHYLWAEVKKGGANDVYEMLTQLLLTCKRTYDRGEHLAPPYLGCFDTARIAFVAFYDILPVFTVTDINWTQTPSSHETTDFQKALATVREIIGERVVVFRFGEDDGAIKEFIRNNVAAGIPAGVKSPITKDNFAQIFLKWVREVKPTINISKEKWAEFKRAGVLDGDFFRADVMSRGGNTIDSITDKLKIVLSDDKYKYHQVFEGDLFSRVIDFTDGGAAYQRFWNRWERPPAEEYHGYILNRRDLLAPENIRETKGSFFTPSIWVKKSREYLERALGKNWRDEYYVWDCAAGTGNLLAGLGNPYTVWASDIDEANVNTINALTAIDEDLDLLPAHVFQFDFLNDSFDKLPGSLKKIIDDPEERRKLIVYINPPYAEAASGDAARGTKNSNKTGVSNQNAAYDKYASLMGKSSRELFALFLMRVYQEIDGCKIGVFSKLKALCSQNFKEFRAVFQAKLEKIFLCPARSFDNVDGNFPIGFQVWDTGKKKTFDHVTADVFDMDGKPAGRKKIFAYNNTLSINEWLKRFVDDAPEIGAMCCVGTDFQHANYVNINFRDRLKGVGNAKGIAKFGITPGNLEAACVYYAARHVIPADWLNDRDQFLTPRDDWEADEEFKTNCLVYTLFNNNIQSAYGVNHWIPYTEKQVGAKERFESNFMSSLIKGKTLSAEARVVYDAGLALWKYYHAKTKNDNTVSVNASFYDIREYFQGRASGSRNGGSSRMNNRSADAEYNRLIETLREALKTLAGNIAPRIYAYGFLRE